MADYPEWVMKYKEKGTYINRVGDKYYLYAAHSERIKGTNKVRRVCDGYLGRITKEDGLIPPKDKVRSDVISYEFGLSFAILSCTPNIHTGLRKSFVKNGDLIYGCSILRYIFGFSDRELWKASYLSIHFPEVVYPDTFTEAQLVGIERGFRMISDALLKVFGSDLEAVKAYFSLVRLIKVNDRLHCSQLSSQAAALSSQYSIEWRNAKWQK
ncbi:MAG: hypothetical protein IJZ34_11125 [Lachnospiraceae bacterium]|nr:hypothetical protein [Lachnospiraceae bacterium]